MWRLAALFALPFAVSAIDRDRDFSGRWTLDPAASDFHSMSATPEKSLTVTQSQSAIRCSPNITYLLDGGESIYQVGEESRNSVVKWEGSALLVNTLVSGPRSYTLMDRWKLSNNRATLTITRQVVAGARQTEGRFVYRNADAPAARLATRPVAPGETVLPAGTHVLLQLRNGVDTRHSREGDRIYLTTAFPIARDGRVVIPQGAAVIGSVTESKRPGRVAGKGELYIRFDSLTLPNGVTRDFRARLENADSAKGKVDRDEGKVTGPGNAGGDARSVARDTGMGAGIGGVAGSAAGNAGKGVGIGAAAGAAAGLAGVLLRRGPDAVLPKGTRVEMILDRDLLFTADELRF